MTALRYTATAALLILSALGARAADFSVTSPSVYTINGMANDPTITVVRGQTYTFAINTSSIHPFRINATGAINNPASGISSGTITWTVPMAVSNYTYQCVIHGFAGTILTVAPPPPPPPTIRILDFSFSSNITLHSTGTNGWGVIPEFSTNLSATNWFALTVQTNRYLSGTNETICGKPPGTNVFIRIRSTPN